MEAQEQLKWEGKVTAKVNGLTAEQVWPLLEDFCSSGKCLPGIEICHQIEGVNGQPGLIRYCASKAPSSTCGDEKEMIKWCHEKLIAIDPVLRCLSYEILDNNLGFNSYIATIKVLPAAKSDDNELGCEIEWSFLADPIDGLTYEGLIAYLNSSLQGMAEKMEKALQPSLII